MVSTRSGRSTQPSVASEKVTNNEAPRQVTAKKSTPSKTAPEKAKPKSPSRKKVPSMKVTSKQTSAKNVTPKKSRFVNARKRTDHDLRHGSKEKERKFGKHLRKWLQLGKQLHVLEKQLAQDEDGRYRNLTKFISRASPLHDAMVTILTDISRLRCGAPSLFKNVKFIDKYVPWNPLVASDAPSGKDEGPGLFGNGPIVHRYDRSRKTAYDVNGKVLWTYEDPEPVISSFCYKLGQK
ncbi:hypothetical protein Slin15195_G065990 [Septoria linicola]|uniref:Uncharacterized protein n=1 Tax=Septoria linicola TaxID=215465 RepID=A0A9Q9EJQ9_9PEZI|nr:hypothetical protein Slin15195_G065990 [Septoria linicola]